MELTLRDVINELDCPELMMYPSFQQFIQNKRYFQRFGDTKLSLRYRYDINRWVIGGLIGMDFFIYPWTSDSSLRLAVVTGTRPNPNVEVTFHLLRFFIQEEAKKELYSYLSDEEWYYCQFDRDQVAIRIPLIRDEHQFALVCEHVKEQFLQQRNMDVYISECFGENRDIVHVNMRTYTLKSIKLIQQLFKDIIPTLCFPSLS